MSRHLFYQTLVGCWPAEPVSSDTYREFVKRISDYMDKAAKEAKLFTSWVSPNHAHDRALSRFVETALRRERANAFLFSFASFMEPIATAGMLNSLSQTLLKIVSPGVPDFYQGSEFWDLSLVDPDNRRAVDYGARRRMLAKLPGKAAENPLAVCDELFRNLAGGGLKMYIMNCGLRFRREHHELFASGAYTPLRPPASGHDVSWHLRARTATNR